MNSETLSLWPLSFFSPSPLPCVSSLLPSLSFGKSISETVTTSAHVPENISILVKMVKKYNERSRWK